MPERPRSERVVFEGGVFSVAREAWPGIDHPYDVVRHPGAAAVLPITPEGEVLLVRQLRPPIRDALLEIPAGLLDREREDPRACAERELLEETGYRHVTIEALGGVYTTAGSSDEFVHLFWSRTEPVATREAETAIELVRRPFPEGVAAARSGELRDAKTVIALLLADARGLGALG